MGLLKKRFLLEILAYLTIIVFMGVPILWVTLVMTGNLSGDSQVLDPIEEVCKPYLLERKWDLDALAISYTEVSTLTEFGDIDRSFGECFVVDTTGGPFFTFKVKR